MSNISDFLLWLEEYHPEVLEEAAGEVPGHMYAKYMMQVPPVQPYEWVDFGKSKENST